MMAQAIPKVTIILVNWNGRCETLACLRSLRRISYPAYDILLVDNGSVDGSVDAVRQEFPEVALIENDQNYRFAHANNQAMERALQQGAAYVLLLNNDTEVAADFLDHLVARAESSAEIGMVGPKIYYEHPPNLLWYAGGRVSFWRGNVWHEGLRQQDHGQFAAARDVDYITGCCLLAKRRCVETIGGLDEQYFMYGEDVDWCFRARAAGFRCVFEPAAKVWHKVSSSSGGAQVAGGLTAFKVFHKGRSMARFFRRRARWYHWFSMPIFIAANFAAAATRLLLGKNVRGVVALFRAATGRKDL